jgi:hypothetical protein
MANCGGPSRLIYLSATTEAAARLLYGQARETKMAKQKGRFSPGKYAHDADLHIKAVRGQKEPFLDLTIRLTEKNVREDLLPQVQKFLRELDKKKQAGQ